MRGVLGKGAVHGARRETEEHSSGTEHGQKGGTKTQREPVRETTERNGHRDRDRD